MYDGVELARDITLRHALQGHYLDLRRLSCSGIQSRHSTVDLVGKYSHPTQPA
jgi:hypothetical protein